MREKIFFIVVSAALLFLLLVSPEKGIQLQHFLFGESQANLDDASRLALENRQLQLELDRLAEEAGQATSAATSTVSAEVFSHYPFNFKSELTVNAGERQGMAKGQAVLVAPSGEASAAAEFLLGYVDTVGATVSTVRTLVDVRWNSAVRVGKDGVDALLYGGMTPTLGLIQKGAPVAAGDTVYSTDPRFPYGATIGRIMAVRESDDKAFQQATVGLGYELNKVRTVLIVK